MLVRLLHEMGGSIRGKVGKREIEAVLADVWTSGKPAIPADMALKGFGARVAPTDLDKLSI